MGKETVKQCLYYLIFSLFRIIMQHHSLINSQIWSCVDINALEELCKSHMDMLNDLGACSVDWDIRMNIERSVKELQCTIPLLDSLSSKDMRPRHWKQILRYSNNLNLLAILMKNGSLEMSVLRHLTVGRFMELKLIYYSTNILAIVERASKEVAIEELLKNLEEVWLGMQFHFKPYLRIHSQEQVHC
jgi:dynein heavy chain